MNEELDAMQRRGKVLKVAMLCACLLSVLGIVFGLSDYLTELLAPEPDPEKIFLETLITEWVELTGKPAWLKARSFQNIQEFASSSSRGKKDWFEGPAFETTVKQWKSQNIQAVVTGVEFQVFDNRETVAMIFHGQNPSVAAIGGGPVPTVWLQSQPVKLFAVTMDINRLDFSLLHWKSRQDPDFSNLEKGMGLLVSLFRDREWNSKKFISRLRAGGKRNFQRTRRWIWFGFFSPSLACLLVFTYFLHQDYLSFKAGLVVAAKSLKHRYGRPLETLLPSFLQFLLTSNPGQAHQSVFESLRQEHDRLLTEVRARRLAARKQARPVVQRLSREDLEDRKKARLALKVHELSERFNRLCGADPDSTARELQNRALTETDPRKRIVILKRAIRLQVLASRKADASSPGPVPSGYHSNSLIPFPVQGIELRRLIWDRLEVADCVPAELDAEMIKAILVVLFKLSAATRIAVHHRRRSTLEQRVSTYFAAELEKTLDRKSFLKCIRWLRRNGVVVIFDDPSQGNYGLAMMESMGESEAALVLIKRILKLALDFKQAAV